MIDKTIGIDKGKDISQEKPAAIKKDYDVAIIKVRTRKAFQQKFKKTCEEKGYSYLQVIRQLMAAFLASQEKISLEDFVRKEAEFNRMETDALREERRVAIQSAQLARASGLKDSKAVQNRPVKIQKDVKNMLEQNPYQGVDFERMLQKEMEKKQKKRSGK